MVNWGCTIVSNELIESNKIYGHFVVSACLGLWFCPLASTSLLGFLASFHHKSSLQWPQQLEMNLFLFVLSNSLQYKQNIFPSSADNHGCPSVYFSLSLYWTHLNGWLAKKHRIIKQTISAAFVIGTAKVASHFFYWVESVYYCPRNA